MSVRREEKSVRTDGRNYAQPFGVEYWESRKWLNDNLYVEEYDRKEGRTFWCREIGCYLDITYLPETGEWQVLLGNDVYADSDVMDAVCAAINACYAAQKKFYLEKQSEWREWVDEARVLGKRDGMSEQDVEKVIREAARHSWR